MTDCADLLKIEVVINVGTGSFQLSREAILLAREISGDPLWGGAVLKGDMNPWKAGSVVDMDYGYASVPRHDPVLVNVVKQLGERANGAYSTLRIVQLAFGYTVDDASDRGDEVVNPYGVIES